MRGKRDCQKAALMLETTTPGDSRPNRLERWKWRIIRERSEFRLESDGQNGFHAVRTLTPHPLIQQSVDAPVQLLLLHGDLLQSGLQSGLQTGSELVPLRQQGVPVQRGVELSSRLTGGLGQMGQL